MKKKKYPFIPLSKKGIVSIFSAALLFSAPLAGPSITMAEGNGTDKVIFDENLEWMKSKTAMNGKTLTINFSDQFAAMGADTVLEAASDKQSVQAVFDKQVLTLTIKDFGETTISVTAKNSKQTVTNTFKVNVTKKGDINGDGTITPADSLYIYQVISGKVKLSSEQQKLLDINGDGKITNLDATTLMSSYVGKNVSATIEENSFVQLTEINDSPVAVDDTYTLNEDEQLKVNAAVGVLANDIDPENKELTATVTTNPKNGKLTFNEDGSFQYVPSANFVGKDRFAYKASDGNSTTEAKTVTINVLPVNDAPVSKDGVLNTQEDTVGIGTLLGEDVDGDTLTYTIVENGKKGKVTILDQKTGVFSYKPNANENGEDFFTYKVSDGKLTSTAKVSVFIKAVNDAPTAKSDAYSTKEDETLTVSKEKSVLLNDEDVDKDSLKAVLVKGTAHGTLDFKADGTFTYIPAKDFNGSDSFVYKATDGVLESAEQTVVLSVGAVNDAPVAKDSSLNVTEDEAASGVVQASDADKDKLTFAIAENGQKGKAVLTDAETGKFTYTPDKNANGEDKIVFTVTDGQGEPVKATVSISIKAVNDAPTAASDSFTTNEDEKLEVGAAKSILNNDTDVDNDALEAILVKATAHGKLELNKDGTFTYTPDKDYSGKDSFTYKATDGKLESAVQTVEIEVKALNDTPTAKDSSLNVTEDEAASGMVEASDADKDTLTFAIAENGQKGKAVLTDAETGKFTYTPDKNANGEDKVVFTVTDGQGEPVKATVSISIKAVNDAPTAASDSFTTKEDEKLTIEAAKSILNNDMDVDNDALEAILVKATAHGKLELNKDGTFTYTPDKDYNGQDSFTYKATDGKLESAVQTVEIEVKAVNDTPTAKDSSLNVTEDEAASGVVQASDADKDKLTFAIAENGQKGKAVLTDAETGNFTYTPDKNANGEDKVVFTVTDGQGEPVKATVSISIKAVNDAPTAASDSFTTKEDEKLTIGSEKSILANDEDVDNDNLQAILVKGPANGLLVLNADGTFTYTPDKDYSGKDSFTYKATDGKLESAEQTVELEVKAVNDTPTADASSIELEEDGSFNGKLTGSDPEGDSLIFSLVENGSKGTAVITNEQTGAFTYTPSKDANGTDSFTFKVNDGNSDSEKATVEVTIKAVNDAPTASDVKLEGTARVGETLTGTYSYHDVENDAEEQSTFQWYSGDKEDGSDKTKIAGATSNEYKITNADLKKYLFFEVKPAAATGEQSSESYLSNASEKVKLADSVAPTIVSTTPANSASEVGVSDDLVITMSENVLAGSGKIEIKNSDGSTFAEYEANDTQHVVIDGATITIKHPDFAEGKEYSIVVGSNAFVDEAENAYVNNNNEWKFETEAAPGLTAYADPSTPLEEEAMKQMFGAFVYVDISGDSFKDGLTADDIILNNVPAGVTVMDQYVMGNNLTLVLGYDGTDFDTKFSNFTVTIKGTALEKGNDLTSNSLEFVPSADAPTPIITEYLHGGDGRSAIEIYSPTPTTEPYKLKIYSLDKGVRKTSEIALRLQYADVNPFLIIDSIFYEYFDIVPNVMYYNEEATLDRGTNIVNALQIIAPNGTVVDTLGDPTSSTPIVTGSVTMVRNTDIKDGIDRYVPSQWNTYTSDIYNHFSKRD
ncbi:Ig-like domain-containing protein [Niallia taxi]|uniref:tandem-95 repeat protein n=1 Tax=Niallia taxi TaxID=2499688 RepID=UPI003D28FD5B